VEVSTKPDGRGIRVACASRLPIVAVEEADAFPPLLGPVQSDDTGGVVTAMGRGVLRVTVDVAGFGPVHVVTAHLKSKLITYPGGPVLAPRRRRTGPGRRLRPQTAPPKPPPCAPTPTRCWPGPAAPRPPSWRGT
jgi:hypothetical protein